MNDRIVFYCTAFLRSLGIGMSGVLLGIYVAKLGLGVVHAGIIIALGLAGTALGTLFVSIFGDRWGRKRTLIGLSLFSFTGGLMVASGSRLGIIALGAFLGMLSSAGGDRGAAYTLEQAVLPSTTTDNRRTLAYAIYGIIQDAGLATGALLAGFPFLLREYFNLPELPSYRITIGLYAFVSLVSVPVYFFLSRSIEMDRPRDSQRVSSGSRKIIAKLSVLFSLDSLGGGFIPTALLSYWFFRRFDIEEAVLGPLFAAGHIANALSYFGATWLASRIGLINTMVFTHIPSNILLALLPFTPSFPVAVLIYLVREFLVQMDVPTRQSYIVAIVRPEERTAITGITNLTRGATRAIAPSVAGYLMNFVSISAPLFICSTLKITYDMLLFGSFRRIRPPEER